MKKFLFILGAGMLLSGNAIAKTEFSKIEHFKCFYDKSTSGSLDRGAKKGEFKLKDEIYENYRWQMSISRIDHNKNTANVIIGSSDRVEDIYIINKNFENVFQQIDFFYPNPVGVGSEFITIYPTRNSNGAYLSVHTSHGQIMGPLVYTYYGWCFEN